MSDTTKLKSIKTMTTRTETTNELDIGNHLPESLKMDLDKLQTLVNTLLGLFFQFELYYKSKENALLWLAQYVNGEMWLLYSDFETTYHYGRTFTFQDKKLPDPSYELKRTLAKTIQNAIHLLLKEGNSNYTTHKTVQGIFEACKKRRLVEEVTIGETTVTHNDPELQKNIKAALKRLNLAEEEEKKTPAKKQHYF